MLLPLDCIVKVLSLIDCPKATMRLCQACRTFGYRLPASEREKGMICEATQLWQAVLARKWGAPVAHTPAECWYNEVRKPAESFARTLSMPISVRAFREADKHTRAAREPVSCLASSDSCIPSALVAPHLEAIVAMEGGRQNGEFLSIFV